MTELRDHKYQEHWEKQIRSDPEVIKDLLGAAFLINTEARRDGTRAVMSHPQLAEYLGVSVSTAQRHIRRLRELGYLDLVERGHRRGDGTVTANVYKLTLRFTVDAQAEAEVDPWASEGAALAVAAAGAPHSQCVQHLPETATSLVALTILVRPRLAPRVNTGPCCLRHTANLATVAASRCCQAKSYT